MADDTKQLLIKISATTELLRSQMIAAEKSVADFESNTNKKLASIDSGFAKLGKGAAGLNAILTGAVAGAVAGITGALSTLPGVLIAAAKSGLDYAGSLGEISQRLGVSTKFLQEFRFAATQNGASVEEADTALGKFSVTLGRAFNGSKQSVAALENLGLNLQTLRTESDSERFTQVADAIAKIGDPAQQAAAAVAIFGKGAQAIIPTLQSGADGFREHAAAAREYGLVLSDKQIQDADKTADKIDALSRALNVKIAATVADNANEIGTLTNALAGFITYVLSATQVYRGFMNLVAAKGVASALLDAGGYNGERAVARAATPQGNAALYARKLAGLERGAADAQNYLDRPTAAQRAYQLYDPASVMAARQAIAARDKARLEYRVALESALPNVGLPKRQTARVLAAAEGGDGGTDRSVGRSRASAPARIKADAIEALFSVKQLDDALEKIEIGQTQARSRVYDALGIDPSGDLRSIVADIDRRRDVAFEANQRIADDYRDKMDHATESTQRLFEDLFTGGMDAVWRDFEQIGLQVITRVLAQLAIAKISGQGSSDIGALFSTALSSVFGGKFAAGGNPPVGRASLVGERGPELFVPRVPGTIVPNAQLGGAQQIVVHVEASDYFDARVQQVTAPMAQAAAMGGAALARSQAARAARRSLRR